MQGREAQRLKSGRMGSSVRARARTWDLTTGSERRRLHLVLVELRDDGRAALGGVRDELLDLGRRQHAPLERDERVALVVEGVRAARRAARDVRDAEGVGERAAVDDGRRLADLCEGIARRPRREKGRRDARVKVMRKTAGGTRLATRSSRAREYLPSKMLSLTLAISERMSRKCTTFFAATPQIQDILPSTRICVRKKPSTCSKSTPQTLVRTTMLSPHRPFMILSLTSRLPRPLWAWTRGRRAPGLRIRARDGPKRVRRNIVYYLLRLLAALFRPAATRLRQRADVEGREARPDAGGRVEDHLRRQAHAVGAEAQILLHDRAVRVERVVVERPEVDLFREPITNRRSE